MADRMKCPEKGMAKTLYLAETSHSAEIADRVGVTGVRVQLYVGREVGEQKVGLTLTRQEQVVNLTGRWPK